MIFLLLIIAIVHWNTCSEEHEIYYVEIWLIDPTHLVSNGEKDSTSSTFNDDEYDFMYILGWKTKDKKVVAVHVSTQLPTCDIYLNTSE